MAIYLQGKVTQMGQRYLRRAQHRFGLAQEIGVEDADPVTPRQIFDLAREIVRHVMRRVMDVRNPGRSAR